MDDYGFEPSNVLLSAGAAPQPSPPEASGAARFDALFDQASKETGIPSAILKAQAMQESTFDPNVISTTGGIGLLQIQPSTARKPGYGVDPIDPAKLTDPAENVRFGARYLAARAKAEGVQDWNDPQQVAKGLAAYNGGGDPNYVQNVFRYLKPPGSAQAAAPAGAQAPANGPFDVNGNPLPPRYGPRAQTPQDAPDAQPAAQPPAPRPFFKPAPGIPVRPGVDMENIGEGARGVFGALAKLNIPGLEVVSGYRDPARNARVGGAKGSQHIQGNAIDINIEKLSEEDRARVIETAYKAGARGIGIYPGGRSLHFDVRETPTAWGANPAAPYSGVSDPNAYPPWARQTLTQLLRGDAQPQPQRAMAYAGGTRPMPPRGQLDQTRNPTVQAAAERGRGPIADRPAAGSQYVEGSAPMSPMQPDLSNAPDGGARDFMLRQAGMAPDMQPSAPDAGPAVGGLGGLGGIRIPAGQSAAPPAASATAPAQGAGGGFDIGDALQAFGMSLLTGDRKNPLKNFPQLFNTLHTASLGQAKTAQEQAALAQALLMAGLTPEQARTYAVNPAAAKIALDQFQTQKAQRQEAEFATRLNGSGQPQPGPSAPSPAAVTAGGPIAPAQAPAMPLQTGAAPAMPQPDQAEQQNATAMPQGRPQGAPAMPQAPAPQAGAPQADAGPPRITTPNKTVNDAFAKRAAAVQEYDDVSRQIISAPTDRAKAAVKAKLDAIEKRIGQYDKTLDQYATGPIKEYTMAMNQRIERGEAVVPFEQWDPEAQRKSARGPQTEEITGYRKEVQGLDSYKNVAQAAPVYNSMLEAAGRNTRSADVNLIYGMAKIMDPGSVVRESEMTVAQAIATLPDRIQQGARSLLNAEGRLSDDVRQGIMTEAYSRMNAYRGIFDRDIERYRGIVGRRGINEADVIPNFGEFKPFEPKPKRAEAGGSTGAAQAGQAPGLAPEPQYVRPDGSSPPMPSPPKAYTRAEWEKLPPGSLYTDAKGDTRRKGSN
ncbi:transglycosylase SLT domain-containing protein [Bosea sp. (in: a-proteobacteria)]|uniref:transglycosylase SLT domain-containing protein n=1 Tax=Bosea sp. (in: a-proteobacteria) TaxID=1871050 RepID=UPI002B486546|nr:transglycosylase SLT domain-containing protein [Bosea sp. (in: a-proteobacteria)]WRH56690.1 MAG: transglycosylase SLT domain-containing protein [Bosea sp. (in: a-proteobacteria)]